VTGPAPTPRLADIPPAAGRRLAVRITPDALRQVRSGHPWVYADSITSIGPDGHPGAAGDLAVIFDRDRSFAAIGLYDPASPIRIRILHVGRPRRIDTDFWAAAVEAAGAVRRPFAEADHANELAYRLVNGENDRLPGLVVDRYGGVLVVKLYSAVWFPHLNDVVGVLSHATGVADVVLRLARNVAAGDTHGLVDGDVISGSVPDGPVRFREGDLLFAADVRHGQKTGHFLDQRANRLMVGAMASGRDVLDVFASTGGFSVHAAAGGARSVLAVDASAPTLAAAEANMALNADRPEVAACRFTTRVGDAFEVLADLGRTGERYDLVVVDPPSFAQRRADVAGARRAYGRLTRLALEVLRPGGTLVQASCSSRVSREDFFDTVTTAATAAGHRLREILRTGHDVDHPVGFPEGEYLKAGFWSVEPDR